MRYYSPFVKIVRDKREILSHYFQKNKILCKQRVIIYYESIATMELRNTYQKVVDPVRFQTSIAWMSISSKAVSEVYVQRSDQAILQATYLK